MFRNNAVRRLPATNTQALVNYECIYTPVVNRSLDVQVEKTKAFCQGNKLLLLSCTARVEVKLNVNKQP